MVLAAAKARTEKSHQVLDGTDELDGHVNVGKQMIHPQRNALSEDVDSLQSLDTGTANAIDRVQQAIAELQAQTVADEIHLTQFGQCAKRRVIIAYRWSIH